MTQPPRSLQARLLALVLATVLVTWGAAAALTWLDARHELGELLDGHLAQAAALLVAQQGEAQSEQTTDAPMLHRYAPNVAFQVFHEGRLALRSSNAPDWQAVPGGADFHDGFRTIAVAGTPWRVFAARGAAPDVQVYVGEQVSSRSEILRAVLHGMLWPMLVALPLLAAAIWWAVAQGVAPLRRLGRVLAGRRADDLQSVEVAGAPAEMLPLVAALNAMFARIATLLESERRFTADAAHELRTPVAAIRAQAQVALGEHEAGARRRALLHTIEGCDRATRLVEQLLTLSRLEADGRAASQCVDVAALAREVVAEIAPHALAKRQDIRFDAPAPCLVNGDPTLLRVLARNLVDNAVRYSPPGARIAVAVATADCRVSLSVDDGGPGLDAPDMQRLGERFFRVAGSDESGSGLGWSIVRRIAAAHGAQLAVTRSQALGGLAVRATFSGTGPASGAATPA